MLGALRIDPDPLFPRLVLVVVGGVVCSPWPTPMLRLRLDLTISGFGRLDERSNPPNGRDSAARLRSVTKHSFAFFALSLFSEFEKMQKARLFD